MPDDSNKAWGMLFESEAWPPPFRVKSADPFRGLQACGVIGYVDMFLAGAAESAPEPFESNKISIFYLTRKGSGQASDSNSIPHALSESSGMQTVPYPVTG